MHRIPSIGGLLTHGMAAVLAATIVAATFLAPTAAVAVDHSGSKEAGLFVGFSVMNENTELGNTSLTGAPPTSGVCFGGRIGYNINNLLGVEGEMKIQPTELEDGSATGTIFGWRAGGIAHLNLQSDKLRPFGWIGVGGETLNVTQRGKVGDENYVEQDTDFAFLLGLGAKYFVMEQLMIRLDARYVNMADKTVGGTAANWEFLFGASWILGAGKWDADNDGIKDDVDKCPNKPEDKDGYQDKDGCPDLDNDGDDIPDAQDKCPMKAEDMDKYKDNDGCPDLDNDRDGIPDKADKCPNKAEDADKFEDEDGCPDLDNDKDGFPDTKDRCPNKFGVKEEGGCPIVDTDKDGIPDKVDKCPKKPETFNGIKDDDGCPEKKKATVVITKSEIKILQKVYFEVNKAEIKKKSFGLLDTVAAVLNSQAQITGIGVEGHTDDTGNDDANMKLSQARAESVRKYLIGKGVPADRLKAKGCGESEPVCKDVPELMKKAKKNKKKLAKCREENRRVTFRITSVNGKEVKKGEKAVIKTKTTIHKME